MVRVSEGNLLIDSLETMTYEEGIGRGRVWFLRLLYELSGEDGDRALSFDRIGDELGFDRKRTSEIVRTLVEDGLLQHDNLGEVRLTRMGRDEVKKAQ